MPTKTVVAQYKDETFVVENTWFSGARLMHNGSIIASNNDMFALGSEAPTMRADVKVGDENLRVEVFTRAILTTKIQIKINGQHAAGSVL